MEFSTVALAPVAPSQSGSREPPLPSAPTWSRANALTRRCSYSYLRDKRLQLSLIPCPPASQCFFCFFFVPALSSLPNDLGLEYRFPVLDVDLLVRRLCGELCLRVPRMLALLRSTAFAFPLKRGSFSYRARSFRVYCEISCL